MLCQICKEHEATIHLTEISDGKRVEMHLCQGCAVEQGIAAKSQMSLNELLSNLLASAPADDEIAIDSQKDVVCPCCGYTLEQFRKESLLGCPNDYEVFEKALTPLIEKAHQSSTTHCGKVPVSAPADTKRQTELLAMKQKLETSIKAEDYETAAHLRDKINKLEN
ncbi:MAG: UvrB/UvrC motif-containing protein [Sedimentisphaerales bacterium]|nr:UvrB/UvrC motif-containing protein [Sedimentisphaerales bacterium]